MSTQMLLQWSFATRVDGRLASVASLIDQSTTTSATYADDTSKARHNTTRAFILGLQPSRKLTSLLPMPKYIRWPGLPATAYACCCVESAAGLAVLVDRRCRLGALGSTEGAGAAAAT